MRNWVVVFMLGVACSFVAPLSVRAQEKPGDLGPLVKGNNAFGLSLFRQLAGKGDANAALSPYSVSTALGMTYAGARGGTEKQMAATLGFSMPQRELPALFGELQGRMNAIGGAGNVKLAIANSLWPNVKYPFLARYVQLLRDHFGVSVTPLDYAADSEAARKTINDWVADKTMDAIRDLIPSGVLDELTRLVLVNAVYFKGDWLVPFDRKNTAEAPFFVRKDAPVSVPMMTQKGFFSYAELDDVQLLRLPYKGEELSMLVVLPRGGLDELLPRLSAEGLQQWRDAVQGQEVRVYLPRFRMTSSFELGKSLADLGMPDAFSPDSANFAGMDGKPRNLFIGAVLHKVFVDVAEEGTEAAAATAVVMRAGSAMPKPVPEFRADRPFLFLIEENATGSILFLGQVIDPSQRGE